MPTSAKRRTTHAVTSKRKRAEFNNLLYENGMRTKRRKQLLSFAGGHRTISIGTSTAGAIRGRYRSHALR